MQSLGGLVLLAAGGEFLVRESVGLAEGLGPSQVMVEPPIGRGGRLIRRAAASVLEDGQVRTPVGCLLAPVA